MKVQSTISLPTERRPGHVRGKYGLQDVLALVCYLAVLLWFTHVLLIRKLPLFHEHSVLEQLQLVIAAAGALGLILTGPQLWLLFARRSRQRRGLVLPWLTLLVIAYCSMATIGMIGALGIASVIQSLFHVFRKDSGLATLLALQSTALLLVGLAAKFFGL